MRTITFQRRSRAFVPRLSHTMPIVLATSALFLSLLAVPTAAFAQTTGGDLLSGYRDWNVVTFGDARLHAESEGAVAVGGTLSFTGTNTAMSPSNVGHDGIGVLAGKVDLTGSDGQLQVLNGSIRLEDAKGLKILNRDQNNASVHTQVVKDDDAYGAQPSITAAQDTDDASKVVSPSLFDRTFNQEAARKLTTRASSDPQGVDAKPDVNGTSTTLTLTKGRRNYWRTTADELSKVSQLGFSNAAPNSGDGTFLIVVVAGTKVTFDMNTVGERDPKAILWDMPQATGITQEGDSLDGSILAPDAHLEKTSANIQGTIIVDSANLAGSEQHYYPYDGPTPPVDPKGPVTPSVVTPPTTPDKPKPDTPGTPSVPTKPTTPATPKTPDTPATPTPDKPAAPITPAKPTTPVDPKGPVTPSVVIPPTPTPATPGKPSVPATPLTPATPTTPTTPTTPAKPVIPVTSTKQTDSTTPVRTLATTGSAVTPIAIGALILLLAAIGLITYRRFHTAR